jgi:hypothetical protein
MRFEEWWSKEHPYHGQQYARGYAERAWQAAQAEQAAEIERLKRGEFTPEEIQHLCHRVAETVSADAFARGCAEYQRRLYSEAPDADARGELMAECDKLRHRLELAEGRNKLLAEEKQCAITEIERLKAELAALAIENEDHRDAMEHFKRKCEFDKSGE